MSGVPSRSARDQLALLHGALAGRPDFEWWSREHGVAGWRELPPAPGRFPVISVWNAAATSFFTAEFVPADPGVPDPDLESTPWTRATSYPNVRVVERSPSTPDDALERTGALLPSGGGLRRVLPRVDGSLSGPEDPDLEGLAPPPASWDVYQPSREGWVRLGFEHEDLVETEGIGGVLLPEMPSCEQLSARCKHPDDPRVWLGGDALVHPDALRERARTMLAAVQSPPPPGPPEALKKMVEALVRLFHQPGGPYRLCALSIDAELARGATPLGKLSGMADGPTMRNYTFCDLLTLEWRQGTCDEFAIVLVGLLRALGVPARLVFAEYECRGIQTSHAFAEYHDGERWVHADPILNRVDRAGDYAHPSLGDGAWRGTMVYRPYCARDPERRGAVEPWVDIGFVPTEPREETAYSGGTRERGGIGVTSPRTRRPPRARPRRPGRGRPRPGPVGRGPGPRGGGRRRRWR